MAIFGRARLDNLTCSRDTRCRRCESPILASSRSAAARVTPWSRATGNPLDELPGTVFRITTAELTSRRRLRGADVSAQSSGFDRNQSVHLRRRSILTLRSRAHGATIYRTRACGGASFGQRASGVRLVLRGRPRQRRAVRCWLRLPLLGPARRVGLERPVDRAAIAIEDLDNAIGPIEVDRIEQIDIRVEDPLRRRCDVPRIGPSPRECRRTSPSRALGLAPFFNSTVTASSLPWNAAACSGAYPSA